MYFNFLWNNFYNLSPSSSTNTCAPPSPSIRTTQPPSGSSPTAPCRCASACTRRRAPRASNCPRTTVATRICARNSHASSRPICRARWSPWRTPNICPRCPRCRRHRRALRKWCKVSAIYVQSHYREYILNYFLYASKSWWTLWMVRLQSDNKCGIVFTIVFIMIAFDRSIYNIYIVIPRWSCEISLQCIAVILNKSFPRDRKTDRYTAIAHIMEQKVLQVSAKCECFTDTLLSLVK